MNRLLGGAIVTSMVAVIGAAGEPFLAVESSQHLDQFSSGTGTVRSAHFRRHRQLVGPGYSDAGEWQ
jgi:hypothetical protein